MTYFFIKNIYYDTWLVEFVFLSFIICYLIAYIKNYIDLITYCTYLKYKVKVKGKDYII